MKGICTYGYITIALLLAVCSIATAATVTQNINYQGVLTDAAGNPLSGTYSMTFRLYSAALGGTALATNTNASVVCANGTFTTPVTFDSGYFDGQALWVGVAVGPDAEMTPRQEIRPEPYALSLRPGAVVNGSDGILFRFTGNQERGVVNVTTFGQNNIGVYSNSTGDYDTGFNAYMQGSNNTGLFTYIPGSDSNGLWAMLDGGRSVGLMAWMHGTGSYGIKTTVTGANSMGVYALTTNASSPAVYGYAGGDGSEGVHGESATATGVYGKGVIGGYFEPNQEGSEGIEPVGLKVVTNYPNAWGIDVISSGITSPAIHVLTQERGSDGISINTGGENSDGVDASTINSTSDGIHAYASGTGSRGVYGESAQDAGVRGKGVWGGFFETSRAGSGDTPNGIAVNAAYNNNRGAIVTTSGTNSPGVVVQTSQATSNGVHSTTSGSTSHAVYGDATGPSSNGVVAYSTQFTALYADTLRTDQLYGIYTPDYLYAKGTQVPATDVAEFMPVAEDVGPGTVMIIGEDGALRESASSYDPRVAGIVSTEPGVSLGTKDTGNPGEEQIAISGRVPCKVDATKTPIHAGDLLTTSDIPGHAMKAEPTIINGRGFYPDGTILGKAMETLESGTGTIVVLVTLQ